MSDKNLELMRKLIEAKQEKSADQKGSGRGPETIGGTRPKIKQHKKGGLFDK